MTTIRSRLAAIAAAGVLCITGLAAAPSAAARALSRCGNADLTVTSTFVDSGAGHSWMSLIYRNASRHTCTVAGFPGLDAVTRSGRVLGHAAWTLSGYGGGGRLRTVTVRPGDYASAGVEWLNFNGATGGSCRFSAAVRTIVANTTRVHRLPVSVSVCGLQVHPTVSGTPQFPHYGRAQHYWIEGSKVAAAEMNRYLGRSERQLKAAKIYPAQVKALAQMISTPLTDLTPKQIRRVHADVKELDRFFATPRLYY